MISRAFLISAIAAATGLAGPALAVPVNGLFHDGPPAAIVMGPPPGGMAPVSQSAATDHAVSQSIAANLSLQGVSDPGIARAANLLGGPSTAHIAPATLEQPAPGSMRDAVAAYKNAAIAARADMAKYAVRVAQDRMALENARNDLAGASDNLAQLRNSVTAGPGPMADAKAAIGLAQSALVAAATRLTTDEASRNAAQAKLDSARTRLALAANRPLTPAVISRLDSLLGI